MIFEIILDIKLSKNSEKQWLRAFARFPELGLHRVGIRVTRSKAGSFGMILDDIKIDDCSKFGKY